MAPAPVASFRHETPAKYRLTVRVPTMSTNRERPVWNRQNVPLVLLGVGILLVLIAAGIVVWVVYVGPVISRLTGT